MKLWLAGFLGLAVCLTSLAESTTIRVPPGKSIRLVSSPDGTVTITVEDGVPDDPAPTPEPKPQPVPSKCWLVVVEETGDSLASRAAYYTDRNLRGYMASKGWKQRLVDKDVKDKDGQQPRDLAPYLTMAKNKKLPYCWLVDQDGVVRHEGQLPATPTELTTIMRRIGGE